MQDEKKKLAVLLALGVVMVGIGAFTLMPQAPAGPTGPRPSGWKPPVDVTESANPEKPVPARNPMVVASLPQRDPFDVPDGALPDETKKETPPAPDPDRQTIKIKGGNWSKVFERMMPNRLGGNLPPESDPRAEVAPVQPQLRPGEPAPGVTPPAAPTFDYVLSGVIVGRRSAAVLRDKQGNQRLVVSGTAIDSDAKLVEVRPREAVVNFRGKTLRIPLQGAPVEK